MNKSLTQYIMEAIKREGKLVDMDTLTYPDGVTVDMREVEETFNLCCMAINKDFSYFAPAVAALTPIFTNAIDTMATDGVRIFINPRFTSELTDEEVIFVILHECMHCILNHMDREKRIQANDHQLANIAADYEVNGILEFDGMIKQGTVKKIGGYIDQKYYNVPFEQIYSEISTSATKPDSQPDPNGGQGQGQQGQSQQGGQSGQNSGSGSGGNNQQQYSPDYIKGWNQAMADYNAGKIKI